MRVDAVPVASSRATGAILQLTAVELSMTMTHILLAKSLLELQVIWIGILVPAPVALSPERHTIGVQLWESLKTGKIHRHSKAAVANSQRRQTIESRDYRIITFDKSFAVDILGSTSTEDCRRYQSKKSVSHFLRYFFKSESLFFRPFLMLSAFILAPRSEV